MPKTIKNYDKLYIPPIMQHRIDTILNKGYDPLPGSTNSEAFETRLDAAVKQRQYKWVRKFFDPAPKTLIDGIEHRVARLFQN